MLAGAAPVETGERQRQERLLEGLWEATDSQDRKTRHGVSNCGRQGRRVVRLNFFIVPDDDRRPPPVQHSFPSGRERTRTRLSPAESRRV